MEITEYFVLSINSYLALQGLKRIMNLIHNDAEIINKIDLLLEKKSFPSKLTMQNPNCLEDMAFEKYLANKHFWEIPKDKQNLMLGDFMFLTDEAFRYYVFEILFLTLKDQHIPLIEIFFQELLINDSSVDLDRYLLFDDDELEIIILFLEKVLFQIKDEIGDRAIYNSLEPWEQVEVDPPFKDYEEEIQTALQYWKQLKNNK